MSFRNERRDPEAMEKIRRAVRSMDFTISLARVPWEMFCTLTFSNPIPRIKICFGMAYAWLQDCAEIHGVPYKTLLSALRDELGETGGRFHFHCLVGGTNTQNIQSSCHRLASLWRRISGGSIEEIRPYNRSLAGASYITKCLDGANAYEVGKYTWASSVNLSDSVYRCIAAQDFQGQKLAEKRVGRGQQVRKNGAVVNLGGSMAKLEFVPAVIPWRGLQDITRPEAEAKTSLDVPKSDLFTTVIPYPR